MSPAVNMVSDPRVDRLREVLARCNREELVDLACVTFDRPEPKEEWKTLSEADLRRTIEDKLRNLGSSDVAYVARAVVRGRDAAGVPYEEIVDDVLEETHVNPIIAERLGKEIGDHQYARELLLTLLLAPAQSESSATDSAAGTTVKRILEIGLKALKVAGPGAGPAAMKALLAAIRTGLPRALPPILGPVGTALMVIGVGYSAYRWQSPNLARCTLCVVAIGSLRLKYFPLSTDQIEKVERLVGSLDKDCRECGKPLKKPEEACVVCWIGLHDKCGTAMMRLDTGASGRACVDCRRKDLDGGGLLIPEAAGISGTPERFAYLGRVLSNRLDRSLDSSSGRISAAIQDLNANAQQLRKDIEGDLRGLLRAAFGYLYAMFFTTLFLTLLGVAYFQYTSSSPSGTFNPGALFRVSLVVMIGIPMSTWFVGALWRAVRNSKREDFERRPDGRRLAFRDYLLGFLYYESPIENIWGPITLIGATIAVAMRILLR